MVLEVAVLNISPLNEAAFEAAMCQARPLISATPGFRSIELRRCVERRITKSDSGSPSVVPNGVGHCIISTARFRSLSTIETLLILGRSRGSLAASQIISSR